jgi:ubiquinone/menaquinone biosynthesis C-methylase UbiE
MRSWLVAAGVVTALAPGAVPEAAPIEAGGVQGSLPIKPGGVQGSPPINEDAQQRDTHARLFPPEQLGLLESADRDEWQQPQRVMDSLGIFDGAKVADVGAGGGWFTIRLSRRVGPNGVVYAEDIQPQMIESIRRRLAREGLTNVKPKLGTAADPQLPKGLHAVLMVDTYPQIREPIPLLKKVAECLTPTGKLGIVDFKLDGAGGPGPELEERVSPEVIKGHAAAAGLKLISHETYLRYQYLLVFGK